MSIQSVGVLGCGLMGAGIAQVCAQSGYRTVVREVDQAVLDKGLGRMRKFLEDGVQKGKATPEARDATLANLSGTTTFDALTGCDLVIEAIVENLDAKRQAYGAVEAEGLDGLVLGSGLRAPGSRRAL
jgi:3-hydroxybutyryl-CoA dehydrogenase